MTERKSPTTATDGHVPMQRGHQPKAQAQPLDFRGGHQPTTGQGGGHGKPPNQGSGGKK